MGGGGIFLKNLRNTTFNKDQSNEPNFGGIHLDVQYLIPVIEVHVLVVIICIDTVCIKGCPTA